MTYKIGDQQGKIRMDRDPGTQIPLDSNEMCIRDSSDIVYQDDLVTAFRDISPQAPTHILIIPNILIPTVNDVSAEHEQALGRMITVAAKIAEQEGIAEDGYRLIMNLSLIHI